jgi:hypothetical protein
LMRQAGVGVKSILMTSTQGSFANLGLEDESPLG